MARIVFMGTPHFAVSSLQALTRSGHQIVGVVTQPDHPAGRGRIPTPSPVKLVAQELELPIYQPERLKRPAAIEQLRAWAPDLIVVAAFGQILPPTVLQLPPHACLNVHASLLPRYRGAAPVAAAILQGDQVTGVTIMLMEEGLDTGPILAQAEVAISAQDTTAALEARLAAAGAGLLLETLDPWLGGRIAPRPQDSSQATYAPRLTREAGRITWRQDSTQISRQVRAYYPWPGAFSFWEERMLKVIRARNLTTMEPAGALASAASPPGHVVQYGSWPVVATGAGWLLLEEIQLEGKRVQPANDFLRGYRNFIGAQLR